MTNYIWIKPHTGNGYTASYNHQGWASHIGHVARAEFVINLVTGEIIKDRIGDRGITQYNPIQYLVDNKYITKIEALDLRLKLNV